MANERHHINVEYKGAHYAVSWPGDTQYQPLEASPAMHQEGVQGNGGRMRLIARKANCFSNNWIGEWYEKDKVDAVLAQKDEEIRKLRAELAAIKNSR